MTHLTRPCGHGKFLPNGEYRPLREGDHWMGTDFSDPPDGQNWSNYAYTHAVDADDGVCLVILECVEDCPNGDECSTLGESYHWQPDEGPECAPGRGCKA